MKKKWLNSYRNEMDSRTGSSTAFMQKKTKNIYIYVVPLFFCFKFFLNMIGKNIADGPVLQETCFLSATPFIL